MEQQLGNATSTTILHQSRNLWKSPRGQMLRIEALVLVAIILTFLTVVFGSCRRWSNHWVIQKGFLAANVLSLSLGTYSIGLMQSSSVKSEMYPIWSVSLFTLFGCVDSVTSYNGIDYMSSLLKMIFQLCLYCVYVLLMSISTISADVGNIAIGMLSAITFIKGFHRALALVLQSRTRNMVQQMTDFGEPYVLAHHRDFTSIRKHIIVDFPPETDEMLEEIYYDPNNPRWSNAVNMADIDLICHEKNELQSCFDMCAAFSLSHKLQRHFLGFSDLAKKFDIGMLLQHGNVGIDYKWALKVIDVELAFLYEIFFTGNTFLHYYHARSGSVCSLASLIGICSVGVAVAIPRTMTSGSTIVDTTTTDLFITVVILVFLALLELMQLIWCWTSNLARVSFACEYARWYKKRKTVEKEVEESRRVVMEDVEQQACPSPSLARASNSTRSQKKGIRQPLCWLWWMRLKWFVVSRTNWFDKHLWQDKLGQCSLFPELMSSRRCKLFSSNKSIRSRGGCPHKKCARLLGMRGLRSIGQVARDLLGVNTKKGAPVRLDDDVKASITKFLDQLKSNRIEGYWLSSLLENGVLFYEAPFHIHRANRPGPIKKSFGFLFAVYVMMWHVATCYCEIAEQEREKQEATSSQVEEELQEEERREKNRRMREERVEREKNRSVAIALSRYCVYLVVSAPELLPGPAVDIKRAYLLFEKEARKAVGGGDVRRLLEATLTEEKETNFWQGVGFAKRLMGETPPDPRVRRCSDPWKALALVWVQMLLFGAPYGKPEAHMRHLSRGGEFITHLWALLYHLGIRKWDRVKYFDNLQYLRLPRETRGSESSEPTRFEQFISQFARWAQDPEEEEDSPGEEGIQAGEMEALYAMFALGTQDRGRREQEEESPSKEDIQAREMASL